MSRAEVLWALQMSVFQSNGAQQRLWVTHVLSVLSKALLCLSSDVTGQQPHSSVEEHNGEDLKIIKVFSCVGFLLNLPQQNERTGFLWHAGAHISVLMHIFFFLKVMFSFVIFLYPSTILHIHSLVRPQEQVCASMCVRCVQGSLQKMSWYKKSEWGTGSRPLLSEGGPLVSVGQMNKLRKCKEILSFK